MHAAHPIVVELPEGSHRICHCGETATPPLCDRSGWNQCSDAAELTMPVRKTVMICTCAKSGKIPLCDGSHGNSTKTRNHRPRRQPG